jgi:hypothetical protein
VPNIPRLELEPELEHKPRQYHQAPRPLLNLGTLSPSVSALSLGLGFFNLCNLFLGPLLKSNFDLPSRLPPQAQLSESPEPSLQPPSRPLTLLTLERTFQPQPEHPEPPPKGLSRFEQAQLLRHEIIGGYSGYG